MDLFSVVYSILAFIVAIGVLVTVHEFGHYWVARKMGVKVLRFSIGFGKPIWQRRWGADQTEYVIARIPLGGYVKMLDEREGDVATGELDRTFNRKSVWRRIAIVAAGPGFNFLFAIFAYYLIFLAGVSGVKPMVGEVAELSPAHAAGVRSGDLILAVNGVETATWEKARFTLLEETVGSNQILLKVQSVDLQISELAINTAQLEILKKDQIDLMRDLGLSNWRPKIAPSISQVLSDGAAAAAGVEVGDKIVSLDGIKIESAHQWVDLIRANPETAMQLQVLRNKGLVDLELTPKTRTDGEQTYGFIGVHNRVDIPQSVRREMTVNERYGPIDGIIAAIDRTWRMSWLTLRVLGKLVVGEASVKNLSGPITIAKYAGMSARIGLEPFLGFLAIISISLGVLNLLPVPMLDGGHLFYYLIEILKGSPVPEQVEIIGQKIGIVLLFGLMSIAIYNDLARLVG